MRCGTPKIFILILIFSLMFPGFSLAAYANELPEQTSEIEYTVLPDGTICITGCDSNEITSLIIPNEIDGRMVTSIGDRVFENCSSISSISLPDSLTSIGNWTFSNCSSMSSITLPEGLTSIGSGAFEGCSSISSITLPEGLTSIGSGAFSGCEELSSISLPGSLTSIGNWTFSNCSSISSVTLPEGLTSIGSGAFSGCEGLSSISLPGSLTSIGDSAFSGCEGLSSISLPDNLTSIGDRAFENCSGISNISLPASLTSIGNWTFSNCSGISNITLSERLTSIGNGAFEGCSSISSISLPDSITSIGSGAFSGCEGLSNIILPDSLTNISDYAFYGCSSLSSITLPDGLTYIGDMAFEGCNEKFTIYGKPNSYAQSYSFEQDIPFVEILSLVFDKNNNSATGNMSAQVIVSDIETKLQENGYTCKGYTFIGWNTKADGTGTAYEDQATVLNFPSEGEESVTLYAQWKANTYNIVFNGNGCTNGSMNILSGCKYGINYTLLPNNFIKTGYTFMGWNTKADGSGTIYKDQATVLNLTSKDAERVTLYAQWKPIIYSITYHLNGGKNSSNNPTNYTVTTKTFNLQNPIRNGYEFKGWFSDSAYTKQVKDITKGNTGNIILYAKWEVVKNTNTKDWPFSDVAVKPGNWKYEAVKYVYENKIMNGVGDGTRFDPDAPLTREMFATVLYRMAGEPAVTFKNKFPDVPRGKWYSNAIIWASEQGIVGGYGDGRFGTGDYITREQIAKMFMEYGKKKGYDVSQRANFSTFADAGSVSGWANDYMKWAVGSGMIGGSKKDGKYYLNPKGNATRVECATMLKRFIEKY